VPNFGGWRETARSCETKTAGVIKGVDHFIGAFREKSSTIEKCDNLALVLFGNVYN
jgi:hypothetical protein